jgi:hypothetical protein
MLAECSHSATRERAERMASKCAIFTGESKKQVEKMPIRLPACARLHAGLAPERELVNKRLQFVIDALLARPAPSCMIYLSTHYGTL